MRGGQLFHSGFLGVDIFFVISGFLITRIILRSLGDGTFSFSDFYFKRARRILPAAYATIAFTSLGAIWFLTSLEMAALRDQVLGALTYTINFVLWNQVDYFAIDAKVKPLLHMWSLAIEEQFYLLLPLLLWLSPSSMRKWLIVLTTIGSFLFCLWWAPVQPVGAFYMLPSRGWELGIGACAAIFAARVRVSKAAFWAAVAALIVTPFIGLDFSHPGLVALGVCIATATVIVAANESAANVMPIRVLAGLGDISYSLYLVHWPIMVFAYCAYVGEPPVWLAAVTVPLSIGLAMALYRFVEDPARRVSGPSAAVGALTLAATVLVAGVYFGSAAYAKPKINFQSLLAPNQGFGKSCDYAGQRESKFEGKCQNSNRPELLIWGDSYAMHLVVGLAQYYKVQQATFSSCMPFIGIALKRADINDPEDWAQRCIAFNDAVLQYVAASSSIKTVVLASPWRGNIAPKFSHWIRRGQELEERPGSVALATVALMRVVRELETKGKKVVLVGPPPLAGKVAGCLERVATGKVTVGACQLKADVVTKIDMPVRDLLESIAKQTDASVLYISDALCDETFCKVSDGDTPIYRDHGHLSREGSKAVLRIMYEQDRLRAFDK